MVGYNISPNLFLESYRLSFLNENYEFPNNLNSYSNSGLTLQKYWDGTAIREAGFRVGADESSNDPSNYTEIKSWERINSLSFGSCTSVVLDKMYGSNEVLLLGFQYPL